MNYPELYLSHKIQDIRDSSPELPKKPYPPSEPHFAVGFGGIVGIIICAGFLLFAVITTISEGGEASVIYGSLLAFGFPIVLIILHYRRLFNEDKQNYEYLQQQYLSEVESYNRKCSVLLASENVSVFREQSLHKWLRERVSGVVTPPSFRYCGNEDDIKKGKSEISFFNKLKDSVPYDVRNDLKIPVGSTFYYPDIVVIWQGLYIDVEIDEPYVEDDGKPIHYMENIAGEMTSVDCSRNLYFQKEGWEIIRFAEEQVVKYPQESIRYLHQVIQALLNNKSKNDMPVFPYPVEKWTEGKAVNYALNKYRDIYYSQ